MIRFFNYGTQGFPQFNQAILTIKQAGEGPSSSPLSGLLRLNNGADQALDKSTSAKRVTSITSFPNNPTKWMYAEFPMAFDPCVCAFNSRLHFELELTNVSTLSMSALSLTADIELSDAQGNLLVNPDYFANLSNFSASSNGAAVYKPGSTIFKEIDAMLEGYRLKLRKIQLANAAISASNSEINKKIAILDAAKLVMKLGTAFISPVMVATASQQAASLDLTSNITQNNSMFVGLSNAQQLSILQQTYIDGFDQLEQFAPDLVEQVLPDGTKKLSPEKLMKKAAEIAGIGFDYFSNHLKKQIGQPLKASIPTGSMTETYYKGTIQSSTSIGIIEILTPGTYPFSNNFGWTELSYPVYNEPLGLFALLETPKFVRTQSISEPGYEVTLNPENPHKGLVKQEVQSRYKLKDPLKFVFNPAAGFDMSAVTIKAAITVEHSFDNTDNISRTVNFIDRSYHLLNNLDPFSPKATFSNQLNNLTETEWLESTRNLKTESTFMNLDQFNDLVCEVTTEWNHLFDIFYQPQPGTLPGPVNLTQALLALEETSTIGLSNHSFLPTPNITLKLLVTYPFPAGADGSTSYTEQLYTYRITEDEMVPVGPGETLVPAWSYTQNPNGNGSLPLQEALGFNEKIWTDTDYALYGGYLNNNGQKVVRPTAWKQINIYGDQMVGAGIAAVEFVAAQEINVIGNAQVDPEITLLLQDVVQATSTPTPPVPQSYLTSYCQGIGPNAYKANEERFTYTPNPKPVAKENRKLDAEINLFPNPAHETFMISVGSEDVVSSVEVFTSDGRLVHNYAMPYSSAGAFVDYSVSDLINGYYYVRVSFTNREAVVKPLAVVRL